MILIVAEHAAGKLAKATLEMVTAAAQQLLDLLRNEAKVIA